MTTLPRREPCGGGTEEHQRERGRRAARVTVRRRASRVADERSLTMTAKKKAEQQCETCGRGAFGSTADAPRLRDWAHDAHRRYDIQHKTTSRSPTGTPPW
jgi:hypothetical protein